jgi:hypothetical protein
MANAVKPAVYLPSAPWGSMEMPPAVSTHAPRAVKGGIRAQRSAPAEPVP